MWTNYSSTTTPYTGFFTLPTNVASTGPQQHLLIGCCLAIGGNLLISISLNLQKWTHMQNEKEDNGKHYLHRPTWWLGIALMALGEVGNFSAYGFAPASLVAPLGTATVVANMFIAVIALKEKLRAADIFGSTLAVLGAFLLVNFAQKEEEVRDASELFDLVTEKSFIIYIVIESTAIAVLLVMKYRFGINNVLVLLLITSLIASLTVISAKAVSGMLQLTLAGNMQLNKVIFYVMGIIMAVTCVVQIKFLNQAMMSFDSTVVVPTNFVFFTISAIVAGIVFYKEFWGMSATAICMFLFGCFLSFIGVYFITQGRADADTDLHESIEDERELTMSQKISRRFCPRWLFSSVPSSKPAKPNRSQSDVSPILSSDTESGVQNSAFEQESVNSERTKYGTNEPP